MKQGIIQILDDVESFRSLFIDYQQFDVSPRGVSTYGGADGATWMDWFEESKRKGTRFDLWKIERAGFLRTFKSQMKRNLRVERKVRGKRLVDVKLTQAASAHHKNPTMETLGNLAGAWYLSHQQPDSIKAKFSHLEFVLKQERRFIDGTWKEVPWADEPWYTNSWCLRAHGAHFSLKQVGMLAYTQSLDKLRRDLQTPIKPGRYLREYFPDLTDEQVRHWSHKFEAACAPLKIEFVPNDQPGKWVEAWQHECQASDSSCGSCMTGEDSVRVYAHPSNNLALAVIWKDEECVARAICNTKSKGFVRAYTDRGVISSNTFIQLLEKEGYTRDLGCLAGQKLKRISHHSGRKFVCPYIDGDYQHVEDGSGDHLVIGDDGLGASNTSGWTDEDDSVVCDHCGDSCDSDDLTWVGTNGNDGVCEHCLENHYTYAYYRGDQYYFNNNDVVLVDGEWYEDSNRNMNHYHFVECAWNDQWYPEDQMVDVAGGDRVHEDNLDRASVVKLDEEYDGCDCAYENDTITLSDDRVVHENVAEALQAEIDAEIEVGEDGAALIPVRPATENATAALF